MAANVSKNIFDKSRLFRRLQFQQGKPAGDYELNELQDILHEFQADTREFIGAFGFWGDGFYVEATGNANEIKVRKGLMLTGDSVIILTQDLTIDTLTTPGSSRVDEVHLVVTTQEVDKIDYPDIVNPSTNQELAQRIQYVIDVDVAEDGVYSTTPAASAQYILFSTLERGVGSATVVQSEINDLRSAYSQTYLRGTQNNSLNLTNTSGLNVSVETGDVTVYGTDYTVAADTQTLADNTITYVYISQVGTLTYDITRPTGQFLELWRVTTTGGLVTNIEDRRRFAPAGLINIAPTASITQESIKDLYPSRNLPEDMYVQVEAGKASYGPQVIEFAGGTSPIFVAPSTNTRIDLLYLDGSGVLTITQGTEGSGSPPSHSGKLPIAEVTIDVGQTAILDSDIKDVRPIINIGGSGSALQEGPGTYLLSSGLGLGNLNPTPSWVLNTVSAGNFTEFTFNPATSTLSWTRDFLVRFNTSSGIETNTIAGPGSVASIADGNWVYFDIDRTSSAAITLVRSASAPTLTDDRLIFGQRAGNNFMLFNGQILYNNVASILGTVGIDLDKWLAIQASSSPGVANVFATMNDLPTVLSDFTDVSSDEAAAFNDTGGLRASAISAANPLAGIADVTAGAGGQVLGRASGSGSTNNAAGVHFLTLMTGSFPANTNSAVLLGTNIWLGAPAIQGSFHCVIDIVNSTFTSIQLGGGGFTLVSGALPSGTTTVCTISNSLLQVSLTTSGYTVTLNHTVSTSDATGNTYVVFYN